MILLQVGEDYPSWHVEKPITFPFRSDDSFYYDTVHQKDEDKGNYDEGDLLYKGVSTLYFTAVKGLVVFYLK